MEIIHWPLSFFGKSANYTIRIKLSNFEYEIFIPPRCTTFSICQRMIRTFFKTKTPFWPKFWANQYSFCVRTFGKTSKMIYEHVRCRSQKFRVSSSPKVPILQNYQLIFSMHSEQNLGGKNYPGVLFKVTILQQHLQIYSHLLFHRATILT